MKLKFLENSVLALLYFRVCNNPAPSLNGDFCFGEVEETTVCVNICPGM